MNQVQENLPVYDQLLLKIQAYYASIWKDRRDEFDLMPMAWINNFKHEDSFEENKRQLNAAYLLSKFMYFGNKEVRELLKTIYRDLFKYPLIREIRKNNADTLDIDKIEELFQKELQRTRFLGVGNPSESGVHLLYYFRQENGLPKEIFINTHDIYERVKDKKEVKISNKDIKRYIFIDDLCGHGSQASQYSKRVLETIKDLNPKAEAYYFMLFGTQHGIDLVKEKTKFDRVEAVFTLDDTFKCFSENSRYFIHKKTKQNSTSELNDINKKFAQKMCKEYGLKLCPSAPLGFKDGQLILGFFHNTPDNSLPIFWGNKDWTPIFKRHDKIYSL